MRFTARWLCATLLVCLAASAAQANTAPLPTQFAGEALTVALAFAFPALVAGAYLAVQRLNARLGARTLMVLVAVLAVVGTLAAVIEDKTALLQRAGLASLE